MVSNGEPLDLEAVKARAADCAKYPFRVDARSMQLSKIDVPALLAEVERLRAEIKARLNEDDYDPAPIIVEYDRMAAEVESLRRQVAGTGSSWLDSVNAYVWRTPNGEQHTLHPSEVDIILPPDIADRLAAERDVIEAAKAWRAARANWTSTGAADGRAVNASIERLCVAVDALSQPVAEEANGGA